MILYLIPVLLGGLWYRISTGITPFCDCKYCEDKRIARRMR